MPTHQGLSPTPSMMVILSTARHQVLLPWICDRWRTLCQICDNIHSNTACQATTPAECISIHKVFHLLAKWALPIQLNNFHRTILNPDTTSRTWQVDPAYQVSHIKARASIFHTEWSRTFQGIRNNTSILKHNTTKMSEVVSNSLCDLLPVLGHTRILVLKVR